MTPDEIRNAVKETIASTFGVDVVEIKDSTISSDVAGWDSLGHTVLMVRLGRRLQTRVPESIASQAKDVGELVAMLGTHLAVG